MTIALPPTPSSSAANQAPPPPPPTPTSSSSGATQEPPAPLWNSLEIAKLTATVMIAVVGGVFTIFTYQQGQRQKNAESERQHEAETQAKLEKAAEKRIAVWQQMSPKINDIYAYMMFIGDFKEETPAEIIDDKRTLDKLMYTNQVLFTRDYFTAYQHFMDAAYAPYRGWLKDAALRTIPLRPHDEDVISERGAVKPEFTGEDCRNEIFAAYWKLQEVTGSELNVYNPDPGKQPDATQAKGIPVSKMVLIERKLPCAKTMQ